MNTHSIKICLIAEILMDALDTARANSDTANELRDLLDRITTETFNHEIMLSTSFMQTIGSKFETAIRKTAQDYNIRL